MLEYLHIRDLALISDMELEFASGMNVLTGETGAGKSFILKAAQLSDGREARARTWSAREKSGLRLRRFSCVPGKNSSSAGS